jgi:hypothetical protein
MDDVVHAFQVFKDQNNRVEFVALVPMEKSVLSSTINSDPTHRVMLAGVEQVKKMARQQVIEVEYGGETIGIATIYQGTGDDRIGASKAREIVEKTLDVDDLSEAVVQEGYPADGSRSKVKVSGADYLSKEINGGYTTFWVDEDRRRRYSVTDWGSDGSRRLVAFDVETDEFLGMIHPVEEEIGEYVIGAERVSMSYAFDMKITGEPLGETIVLDSEGSGLSPDDENEAAGLTVEEAIGIDSGDIYLTDQSTPGLKQSVLPVASEKQVADTELAAVAGSGLSGVLRGTDKAIAPELKTVYLYRLENLFE